jgi:hypothetical protein
MVRASKPELRHDGFHPQTLLNALISPSCMLSGYQLCEWQQWPKVLIYPCAPIGSSQTTPTSSRCRTVQVAKIFPSLIPASIAKDRGWFKTYTPFTSTIENLPVLGIGTVEIPTKRSPNLSGVSSHGSLHLKEVLHVPGFICNIIGSPILFDGYNIETGITSKSKGAIKDSKGKTVAYFDPKSRFFALKVRGNPTGPLLGPHVFKEGTLYVLSCYWDSVEQQKWQEFKEKNGLTDPVSGSAGVADGSPPYTADEKTYLKENWRDEYHFLLEHGLNIHKEVDRAEGRSILRAFRDEDDVHNNSEDDEFDLEGHQADYNFSHSQLDWIEKHYGNSESFMLSYGLKFYDNDDIEEAKAIVDAMMAQDEENIS